MLIIHSQLHQRRSSNCTISLC